MLMPVLCLTQPSPTDLLPLLLQVHGAVGLRSLLSVQHSVQLSPESSASLIASWQPNMGMGLQVGWAGCLAGVIVGVCIASWQPNTGQGASTAGLVAAYAHAHSGAARRSLQGHYKQPTGQLLPRLLPRGPYCRLPLVPAPTQCPTPHRLPRLVYHPVCVPCSLCRNAS